ncbi:hypothetical protein C8Q75DRAFT_3323 [Abortiporus biennis]|nr:hypothetical protein C8Q75DRAFT_3323 [Abortiporus biennis]
MLRLPSEIFDLIIDILHGDISSLCSCSLVCKAWLTRSQFNLFETTCIWHCHDDEGSNLDLFIEILEELQFPPRHHIRKLSLAPYMGEYRDFDVAEIDATHLQRLVVQLPSLQLLRLHLVNLDVRDRHSADLISQHPLFPSTFSSPLQSITLYMVTFRCQRRYTELI